MSLAYFTPRFLPALVDQRRRLTAVKSLENCHFQSLASLFCLAVTNQLAKVLTHAIIPTLVSCYPKLNGLGDSNTKLSRMH